VSHELGFDEQINVSAISGRRSGDLLDLIVSRLPRSKISKASAGRRTRIAIVGRPNVGKSTLFNELIGADRSIVSATPGTTRDAIKSEFGDEFEIIDTAGFRRRGKIVPGIEKFSAFRTIRTISEADLVLVVVDAEEGLTRQDAHIVEMAQKMKKRTIIVLNKIDLLKDKSTEGVKNFYRYPFINKIPSVGISALKKENIDLLLKEIECTS
jgi:GTP-binding protein